MAKKRANSRTNSIIKTNKSLSRCRRNSRLEQQTNHIRINRSSLNRVESPQCSRAAPKRRAPSYSGLYSECSIIDTPRSSDHDCSSFVSLVDAASLGHSKRKRSDEPEDPVASFPLSCHRLRNRAEIDNIAFGETFDIKSQHCSSVPIFESESFSSSVQQPIILGEIPNHEKTGSWNSKKSRGKGYAAGVSMIAPFIIDPNQPSNEELLSSTSNSVAAEMAAGFSEGSRNSASAQIYTRVSEIHEDTGLESSGSGGVTSSWLRSFTCFSSSGHDEQTPLDFSVSSASKIKMAIPSSSDSRSSVCVADGLVFSNSTQSTSSRDFPGSSTGSGSGGILRFVPSFSSSSSKKRQNRGLPCGRLDVGKRGHGGINRSGDSSGNHASSSMAGLFVSHHHGMAQQQGSGVNYRISQLQQSAGDLATQLILLQEINQALLMSSEESLEGMAVPNLVSVVVSLLDAYKSPSMIGDEIIELKNLICNILAHLMDVMPKAADAVVVVVPLLLSTMACSCVGDILDRIINVLEQVSRRHGREILHYGGVTTVMGYYDFVTVAQHRTILSMVANCFTDVRRDDFFEHIASCLPSLCNRLACENPGSATEPRCLERVCSCFARLIDAYRDQADILREIASFGLCEHLRQILAASPPIVSNLKDTAHMLARLCSTCPDLAVNLLQLGYTETLYTLLTDQKPPEKSFILSNTVVQKNGLHFTTSRTLELRGPENVYAIISLIRAIMPPLPEHVVTLNLLSRSTPAHNESTANNIHKGSDVRIVLFQQQCSFFEEIVMGPRNRSHQSGDPDVGGLTPNPPPSSSAGSVVASGEEDNLVLVKAVHLLLPMLFDLYLELNGIAPRLRCIEAIQRMVYYASPFVLSRAVSPRSVSSVVAGMLACQEFVIIAAGLQLANLFITRIPLIFSTYFRREGVMFHLQRLASIASEAKTDLINDEKPVHVAPSIAPESPPVKCRLRRCTTTCVDRPSRIPNTRLRAHRQNHQILLESSSPGSDSQLLINVNKVTLPDAAGSFSTATKSYGGGTVLDSLTCSTQATPESPISSASSSNSTIDMDVMKLEPGQTAPSPLLVINNSASWQDSNLRVWITNQCKELYQRIQTLISNAQNQVHNHETLAYKAISSTTASKNPRPVNLSVACDVMSELELLSQKLHVANDPAAWIEGVQLLSNLLIKTNISEDEPPSAFEFQQSGILEALRTFLSQSAERRLRLFIFLRVFVGPNFTENICLKRICENHKMLAPTMKAFDALQQSLLDRPSHEHAFPVLINCLLNCLHQQEHFQVLTGPTAIANANNRHEEDLASQEDGNGANVADGILSYPTIGGGGVAVLDGKSHRRSGTTGPLTSTHKSVFGQPQQRLLSRVWATVVPGFLKLELVRLCPIISPSVSSSGKSPPENEASLKCTFWENAPVNLPLHVNALITAKNLQRLLMQRSFMASLGPSTVEDSHREHHHSESVYSVNSRTNSASSHSQHPLRRRVYSRQTLPSQPSPPKAAHDVAGAQSKSCSAHSVAPYNLRHEKSAAQTISSSKDASKFATVERGSVSVPSSLLESQAHPSIFSRPKTESLQAAFKMLHFSGSSTSPSTWAAASQSSSSAQLSPNVSLPLSLTAATHPHGRTSGSRKDHSHLYQYLKPFRHCQSTSELLENVLMAPESSHGLVPIFYINGMRVSDQMSLYQALRVFSADVNERGRQLLEGYRFSMTEQNREDQMNAYMWRHVHKVHYRLERLGSYASSSSSPQPSNLTPQAASNTSKGASLPSPSTLSKVAPTSHLSAAINCLKRPRRPDDSNKRLTTQSVVTPLRLFSFLEPLSIGHSLSDEYLSTNLMLLRVLYGLSEIGSSMDDLIEPFPIISASRFRSQKLSAKASRQLQDVFCVLAGNLPDWLVQMISTCPFLFPFSVRQNFFYVHNFDRDRTILHLQDSILNSSADSELPGSNGVSGVAGTRGSRVSTSPFPHLPSRLQSGDRHPSLRLGGFEGGSASALAVLESLLVDSTSQVQRRKITVQREPKRLLRAAESTLSELRDSRAILEIAFEGEIGFGLGPTLEFYTLVSHQLMTSHLNLWHGHNYTSEGYVIAPAPGLYPRPLAKNVRASVSKEVRTKFFFLGQLMARSLLDWRQMDLSLSPTLFKWFLYVQSPEEDLALYSSRVGVTPADMALVDPQFAKHFASLKKMCRKRQELGARSEEQVRAIDAEIEDLCLNFTLPGYQIELCRNGSQTFVTGDNLAEYLHLAANWLLVEGVRRQIISLIEGFDSVLPGIRTETLSALFRPDECEGLFCGSGGTSESYRDQFAFIMCGGKTSRSMSSTSSAVGWDIDTLTKSCLCDHGYTLQSKAIQYLFEIMSEFDEPRRRLFIQFATGSPRLPIGGFRALKPPLKIVMKREAEEHADRHLPSVMTCQNYLKLPNYSSKEIMREKLLYAIHEGQHAFHLS